MEFQSPGKKKIRSKIGLKNHDPIIRKTKRLRYLYKLGKNICQKTDSKTGIFLWIL